MTYGANHAVTGKAAYTSASVYADSEAVVHLESKAHTELKGSAADFISDQPNADEFYARSFTRAADGPQGPHVTTLPPTTTVYCAQYGTTTPVDMGTVNVLTRVYIEPATNLLHYRPGNDTARHRTYWRSRMATTPVQAVSIQPTEEQR